MGWMWAAQQANSRPHQIQDLIPRSHGPDLGRAIFLDLCLLFTTNPVQYRIMLCVVRVCERESLIFPPFPHCVKADPEVDIQRVGGSRHGGRRVAWFQEAGAGDSEGEEKT